MNLKNSEHQAGYDIEELYFEKLNRELIQKLKGRAPATAPATPPAPATESRSNVIPFPTVAPNAEKKKAA